MIIFIFLTNIIYNTKKNKRKLTWDVVMARMVTLTRWINLDIDVQMTN